MGFGSYDESERENQEIDTDLDGEGMDAADHSHDGSIEFEFGSSNEALIDQLREIKEE
jgi:hypothetical protein